MLDDYFMCFIMSEEYLMFFITVFNIKDYFLKVILYLDIYKPINCVIVFKKQAFRPRFEIPQDSFQFSKIKDYF